MTSLRDGSGNTLNKTELLALLTEQTLEKVYKVNDNAVVNQVFTFDGGEFEAGEKTLLYPGEMVTQSFVDGLFKTATATAISPASVPAAGGTVVTITGTNLAGSEGVTFGGTAGTAFKVISNTQVQVTTPAKTAGAYTVVVKDDAGDVTKPSFITYT
jgi:hypothetical protein